MKSNFLMKKLTAFAASLVITFTSVGATFSAFAADPYELPVLPVEQQDNLPAKFDLRNINGKNYVTPVKMQNPFQTCWSFSAAAAAETTYLYANGLGVAAGKENNGLDISEKHTAWYTFQPISKQDVSGTRIPASQVGEGYIVSNKSYDAMDHLGKTYTAFETYARYGGPVAEGTQIGGDTPFTYNGKNKWVTYAENPSEQQQKAEKEYLKESFIKDVLSIGIFSRQKAEEVFENNWKDQNERSMYMNMYLGGLRTYAAYDDWSLPLNSQYRLADTVADIKDYKIFSSINANEGNGGEYKFSAENLKKIKKELVSGHAMVAAVAGDVMGNSGNRDDSVEEGLYINKKTWAQYANKPVDTDHGVTVVGYDDNYPKENFLRKGKDGKDDLTSIPPENGAFIVKNSWGCVNAEDEKTATVDKDGKKSYKRVGANEFGINNSGYYFISYYDMSISDFTSVDLYKKNEQHAENANQYDLLTTDVTLPYYAENSTSTCSGANVFTAQQDEFLSEISVFTIVDNSDVKYSIYKNFKGNDPTTGELLESGSKKFETQGYFRFALDKQYLLRKGEKYAVVIGEKGSLNEVGINDNVEFVPVPMTFKGTKGVINKGESLICINGKWSDLTEQLKTVRNTHFDTLFKSVENDNIKQQYLSDGADSIVLDNLPIRAYTTPTAVRFAGKNRYDTAAKISSESGLFNNSDTVVIANGINFADALAGVPLAKAFKAPILLTAKDMLPADTASEIKRLGAKNAIILGGPGAVSETVENELTKMGLTAKRLSGLTRFATAKRVAEALEKQSGKAPSEVFFVIYNNFADALSASTVAAVKGAPILYVTKEGAIDKFTELYIDKNKSAIKKAYVIGGEGVITDQMKESLSNALGGKTVERVAGANRYATCVAVNDKFSSVLKGKDLCVAKGGDFPDALAGGVFAALNESPLFLAGPVLIDTQINYLNKKKVNSVYVFGGTGAVSDAVIKNIRNCLA